MTMQGKLSVKLGLVIGMIIFCSVVVSYLSIEHRLTKSVVTTIKQGLYRDLLLNKEMVEQRAQQWQTTEQRSTWAKQVARTLDIRVTLIDLDGGVITDSALPTGKLALIENHRNRPEVKSALANGYGENTRYSQTVKEHMLYMAVPVGLPKPYAILRFSTPLYDIELCDTGIRTEITQSLVLALFFSLVAGFLAAFFLARPIRTLAKTAQKRIHGDVSGTSTLHHKDETGVIARALNVMTDEIIKLRHSEEWLRAVFSGIREAIIVTDATGDIIMVNPAASRMFRINDSMFKSRPIRDLSDSKLQELFTRVHSTRIALRKEELSLMTTKGACIMQISSMPLTKEKQFEGTVFVLNDITKLRNLEKIRRDFVASVSHELRTPLSVITGYTETLLDGAMHEPEHATAFLQTILQATEQLTALVNDVLDLSRIESGHIQYTFSAVDLKRMVQQSVDLLKPSLDKKQIRLDLHIPDALPPVYADPRYLDIVIRNLLDNAIKYVDDRNGKIRISAFRSNDDIRLEIEDNGIGISQADLGRIFERFYRVDKARSRERGGTGLGLAIVKHIVMAHKGNVEVHSRVNQGSRFSVMLRMAKVDESGNAAGSTPQITTEI
jgi:two-component system, OmpR family, phosphate regulon sensor histidine kinase PhoR